MRYQYTKRSSFERSNAQRISLSAYSAALCLSSRRRLLVIVYNDALLECRVVILLVGCYPERHGGCFLVWSGNNNNKEEDRSDADVVAVKTRRTADTRRLVSTKERGR